MLENGTGGYLLTYSPFLEYLEGSNNWQMWRHANAIGREHAIFFSAYTYGLIQFKNKSTQFPENEKIRRMFSSLRNSSLNSRLIVLDATIMDIAAQAYLDAIEEGFAASDISPFIEFATAAHWNLTLTISDRADDHFRYLIDLVDYPKSTMRIS